MMDQISHKQGKLTIWLSAGAGVLLVGGKLVLGILGHSQALIADAVHSATDFITDIIAFLGLHFAFKKEDRNHPFGHGKIDSMMSILIGLSMVIAGLWLGFEAVANIINGQLSHPNQLALWGAGISIVVKEALFRYTLKVGKRLKSQSLIANAWHHRSDVYSSIAVLIGVIPGVISPDWAIFDSLAATIVSTLIIKAGTDVIAPAFMSTIDTAPEQQVMDRIEAVASSVEGVHDAHDIRGRYYSSKLYLEVHIVVDPEITVAEGHLISVKVKNILREQIEDILDIIVHVDPDETEWNQPRFSRS